MNGWSLTCSRGGGTPALQCTLHLWLVTAPRWAAPNCIIGDATTNAIVKCTNWQPVWIATKASFQKLMKTSMVVKLVSWKFTLKHLSLTNNAAQRFEIISVKRQLLIGSVQCARCAKRTTVHFAQWIAVQWALCTVCAVCTANHCYSMQHILAPRHLLTGCAQCILKGLQKLFEHLGLKW